MTADDSDPVLSGSEPGTPVSESLLASILVVLRDHPAGLSEHAVIDALRQRGVSPFARNSLREPLGLFQSHFLLFHCLYRLRDRQLAADEWLRIDCLDIGLEPLEPSHHGVRATARAGDLDAHDPLRAYYMDLSRLAATDAAAVQALLSSFWRRLRSDQRRQQALAILELEEPADAAAIAARFRTLVQRHHPDRGGDTATLQRLNEARWILLGGPR